MAAEYYTADSVRNQLPHTAEFDLTYAPPHFSDNWVFCPCFKMLNGTCYVGCCKVRLGIFFSNPLYSIFNIEILYIKQKHSGFIRADTPRLKNLVAGGIISKANLVSVFF